MPNRPRTFLIVVRDEEIREFTVVGPMSDDTEWTHRVAEAQKQRTRLFCSTTNHCDLAKAIAEAQSFYGYDYVDDIGI